MSMTTNSATQFDTYTLKTRVAPALLAAAPAIALGVFALPYLPDAQKLWGVVALGLTTYGALVARKAGNKVQPTLWSSWGGPPTALRLRYGHGANASEIDRRHRDFERALGGSFKLPTAAEQDADPEAADSEYQEAARRLIGIVRNDPSYPLLNLENRNYGYARNLLGLKPLGLSCSWLVLTMSALATLAIAIESGLGQALGMVLPLAVSVLALLLWRQVDDDFVRPSADAYADRLLEAAQHRATLVE